VIDCLGQEAGLLSPGLAWRAPALDIITLATDVDQIAQHLRDRLSAIER
jgi:hypothetical protein